MGAYYICAIKSQFKWLISFPVSITVYVICAIEFFVRFWKNKPVRGDDTSHKFEEGWTARMGMQMKIMIIGLTFNTTCLFIR